MRNSTENDTKAARRKRCVFSGESFLSLSFAPVGLRSAAFKQNVLDFHFQIFENENMTSMNR
jgi:hypothetical protein